MRMDFISIGDVVRDNSCGWPCIDTVVGVRYNNGETMYKMRSTGMYVPSSSVEKVGCPDD